MKKISIENLSMSTRSRHILHKLGIETVDQLMETQIEIIAEQKNVGAKTVSEIENIMNKLNSGEIRLTDLDEQTDCMKEVYFSSDQLLELSKHSISELGLPIRTYNALNRAGYFTLDKVAVLRKEDFAELKNIGRKSINDILQSMEIWLNENMISVEKITTSDEIQIDSEVEEYFHRLTILLLPLRQIYWYQLYKYAEKAELLDRITYGGFDQILSDNIIALLEIPDLREDLKAFFLKLAPDGVIGMNELEKKILCQDLELNKDILFNKLCDGTICTKINGYIFLKRSNITEFMVQECDKEKREFGILEKRLNGDSLQNIALDYGITRERVRQIAKKTVHKFPLLWEDYFKEPFEYFRFSKEEFSNAFLTCGKIGYEYLMIKYIKGKEELTEDSIKKYDGIFANRLKDFLKEKTLRHDKQTVSRTEMVYRILLSNSDRAMSMDEFESAYYAYLDTKGYPRTRLKINMRTVTNFLRNAKHIVFNEQNCVRYCDADYHQLWKKIDFNQYKNLVISSDRIFQDYRDLMEELDIRDGYELFYVIKSSLENWNRDDFEINCRRVPVIIFGEGDEAVQAVRFLKEISPVDYHDYYQAYEERYGVHKESAQGNPTISNALSVYYIGGQYVIDVPAIDERDVDGLKKMLSSKKIWFIDDLEKVFEDICVHSSDDALNAAALKRIGYSLNAGYAYNVKYGSVSNFFDMEIFTGDIVDMNEFDRRLTTLSAFISALEKKKNSLEYIETAPKILMSSECVKQHYGIKIEEIKRLQRWILLSCEDKYFNAHSLWNSIKDEPIIQKLQNNEWMCTCIFRQQEGIYSLTVAGGIILTKDSNSLSLCKVCEWIIEKSGKLNIQSLTRIVNDTFGTNIPYYKIADKLKTSGKWEDFVIDSFDNYLDTLLSDREEEAELFREEFF